MRLFKRKVITLSSGHRLRPAKGKCPVCKAKEKEYCKPECSMLDGYDPRDR